jgi:hypothetical protein
MDGRRKPDLKPEKENEPVDEEIIDLTQVIEGEDNDDIIDLNDILEQPDQASEETDETALPLVDVISTEAPADLADVADDDIIDLENVATTLEADMADTEPESDTVPADEAEPLIEADQEDEAVIDLMEVAALDSPAEDAVEPSDDDDQSGVIDLTDIEAPEPDDEEFADLQSRAEAMLAEAPGSTVESAPDLIDQETPEEAAETAGPDVDFRALDEKDALVEPEPVAQPVAPVIMAESPAPDPIRPTDQQVDAALERVIEKIYSEKIEQMMIQTIEKTVKREIEKIKTALLEDSDGMAG